MKNIFLLLVLLIPSFLIGKNADKIELVEYDLENGLHVILCNDPNEPNVVVGVKYHVGAKNEEEDRTGFAHFYEHLLFHGTKNIPQGEFENIIMNAGGYCNAYTTYDVTYYYEFLPAHEFKLGLWAESERMLHPIITEEGIKTERKIVKEEKRMRYDNKPLGNAYYDMMGAMFDYSKYGHNMIGSMDDLDASSLKDFSGFFETYYIPNNACLVLAGNIDVEESKKWIAHYFNDIPRGKDIKRPKSFGKASGKEKIIEKTAKGITNTVVTLGYYTMPETHEDANAVKIMAALLSGDSSYSMFENNVMENDTLIPHIKASAELWEKVGAIRISGSVKGENNEKYLIEKMEEQLELLKNEKVDPVLLQRIKNTFENGYTDLYYHSESLANAITQSYHFNGNTKEFYKDIDRFLNVTPDDIQRIAKKYFTADNRAVIIYHPEK